MIQYATIGDIAASFRLSVKTVKGMIKKLPLVPGEHYVKVGKNTRYHPQKIHDLLISKEERELSDKILERFMV